MAKCYRCGYCCIYTCVAIVVDPAKGVSEGNITLHNANGENIPCRYLQGDGPGRYSCAIHSKAWYVDTPCAMHNSDIAQCTVGEYLVSQKC